MAATFVFLGTGASAGVPVIGCQCAVCLSSSSKNKRFRPSGLLEAGGKSILIDIGPDFRSQAIRFKIRSIDALLLTHTHYDHIAGIDEIRVFNVMQKKSLPCLLSGASYRELRRRYYYLFDEQGASAKLDFKLLEEETGKVEFLGFPVVYCTYFQHSMQVTGFRLGEFAYISDVKAYSGSMLNVLKGVRKLVVSALRSEPSPHHLSFEEAVRFAEEVGAEETWLTHVGHFLDHDAIDELLPPQVRMGYDGLKLEFAWND